MVDVAWLIENHLDAKIKKELESGRLVDQIEDFVGKILS